MEILDLYTADGKPSGLTVKRGERVPHGYYLMLVSVLTKNSAGQMLLTRRAKEKKYAGRWEITGGCVQAGETARQGAVRELSEETGILVTEKELIPRGWAMRADYIHAFFEVHRDVPAEQIRLQPGETDSARWVEPAEFLQLSEQHETGPHHTQMILSHYPALFKECGSTRSNI